MKSSLVLALLLVAACEEEPAPPVSPPELPAAPRQAGREETKPSPEPAAEAAAPPRQKEAGESEAFGQLPDGVGLAVGSALPQAELLSLEGSRRQDHHLR